jgi:hypothetical protein
MKKKGVVMVVGSKSKGQQPRYEFVDFAAWATFIMYQRYLRLFVFLLYFFLL